MGMRELEASILRELRTVTGDRKIRQKDIQEWSTSECEPPRDGEKLVRLPDLHVNVVYSTVRT